MRSTVNPAECVALCNPARYSVVMRFVTAASVVLLAFASAALGGDVAGDAARARPRTTAFDSIATRRQLDNAADAFLIAARDAWADSAEAVTAQRVLSNVHCHYDGSFNGRREGVRNSLGKPLGMLRSSSTSFSICPDWQSSERPGTVDESARPDASLVPTSSQRIGALRFALIATLDSAAALLPHDQFIAGQRVRFRVDAGDMDGAMRVARSCTLDPVWCMTLAGYAMFASGNVAAADSLFLRALAAMPDSARCVWSSVQPLLGRDEHDKYEKLSCAQRDSVNRSAYWLGDPLWSEPGNERRAEQLARVVHTELTFALRRNERWDLREGHGGDAVRLMFLRYGWPTVTQYGGSQGDQAHDTWLGPDAIPPYSAPEYSRDRVSTLPLYEAMLDPMSVQDNDFVLTAPRGDIMAWWPTEHFKRKRGIVASLAQGQTALFRRDGGVLMAVATKLSAAPLTTRYGQRVTASLVLSPRPDSVTIIATQSATLGDGVLLRARIAKGQTLVGVEVQTTRGAPIAARSRFGVVAPSALSEMRTKETAVSMPVRFDPQGLEAAGQTAMVDPFDYMYNGLQFSNPQRLGVFWESYGFEPGDSVSVTVRLERVTPVGRFRRIGMAMRVAADPNGVVTASWTEPEPGRSAARIVGSIPVLARHLTLDVRTLQTGRWRLRVSMHRPREADVSADRLFEVRR